MFEDMAVEHVDADVVGELQLQLERLARPNRPGLLHRFPWITSLAVAAEALLVHIVDVDHVRRSGWIGEDPLLRRT